MATINPGRLGPDEARIAYFSMEIAVAARIPTYAGGLGVLAGDTLRSAADLGIPMVGVTLLHRKGYFLQSLDGNGIQTESPQTWEPEELLEALPIRVKVQVGNRPVAIRAWRYEIAGVTGNLVPVYFLDTHLPENSAYDQTLTDSLYGGDSFYRLCQEVALGIGGMQVLRALGHDNIVRFHMNEGHSAFLALALLEERVNGKSLRAAETEDVEAIRSQCVFTTHTPVPAAFDQFRMELASQVLGPERVAILTKTGCCVSDSLNMTFLALRCSRYINGVAMRHGELSHSMFPNYPIHSITNGVHAATWTSRPFQELFDKHIPEWRRDNLYLRYAIGIRSEEIQAAHKKAKAELFRAIARTTGISLDESVVTIGFGRRATEYKRADFIFSDLERLRSIRKSAGPLQIIFGGKAHPSDDAGKAQIQRVLEAAASLRDTIPVVYVPDYDMGWAQFFTSGVDLWLNTPHRPFEASGTSGMKAALNGIPSLSVRDGWWVEGHLEGVTGWSIGYDEGPEEHSIELASLYEKLERIILPMYYSDPRSYATVMRSTIAMNGSFFNTQRMLSQYLLNAYNPTHTNHLSGNSARKADQQEYPVGTRR